MRKQTTCNDGGVLVGAWIWFGGEIDAGSRGGYILVKSKGLYLLEIGDGHN